MKAYRHADGSIWTFRPEANAARFARSARRLALPELPRGRLHRVAAPARRRRPGLGAGRGRGGEEPLPAPVHVRVRGLPRRAPGPARSPTRVIASPAGRLLLRRPQARDPVDLDRLRPRRRGRHRRRQVRRQLRSSLAGQLEGIEHGCDQAVFLDSSTHTYIEELGGMNLFLVTRDGRIVTPELTGSILEGVTRSSILEIAKEVGLEPEERRIPIEEWKERRRERRDRRGLRLRHRRRRHPRRRAALGRRLGRPPARGPRGPLRRGDPRQAPRHPVRPRGGHARLADPLV